VHAHALAGRTIPPHNTGMHTTPRPQRKTRDLLMLRKTLDLLMLRNNEQQP